MKRRNSFPRPHQLLEAPEKQNRGQGMIKPELTEEALQYVGSPNESFVGETAPQVFESQRVPEEVADGFGFHGCPVPILKEMKRATLALIPILLPLLTNCIEPKQVAEDRLSPYRQSLLPGFQGDIAPLGEIPRYCIAP